MIVFVVPVPNPSLCFSTTQSLSHDFKGPPFSVSPLSWITLQLPRSSVSYRPGLFPMHYDCPSLISGVVGLIHTFIFRWRLVALNTPLLGQSRLRHFVPASFEREDSNISSVLFHLRSLCRLPTMIFPISKIPTFLSDSSQRWKFKVRI